MAVDDSYTKYLFHFDMSGGNPYGSFFVPDEGGHTSIGRVGNATLSSTTSKFGSYSLKTDGNGDYLALPDSADHYFGSGDWTIDFWVYFNNLTATFSVLYSNTTDTSNRMQIDVTSANQLRWSVDATTYTYSPSFSTSTWYHMAFVRTGSTFRVFKDGTQLGSDQTAVTVGDYTGGVRIGCSFTNNANCLNGYFDEFRISKGIARWTTTFTAPTEQYGTSPTVVAQAQDGASINCTGADSLALWTGGSVSSVTFNGVNMTNVYAHDGIFWFLKNPAQGSYTPTPNTGGHGGAIAMKGINKYHGGGNGDSSGGNDYWVTPSGWVAGDIMFNFITAGGTGYSPQSTDAAYVSVRGGGYESINAWRYSTGDGRMNANAIGGTSSSVITMGYEAPVASSTGTWFF